MPILAQVLTDLHVLGARVRSSVIIGLSGTPLCDVPQEAAALRNLIKGRHHQTLTDEGFVSYYMETPSSVFPRLSPSTLPDALPASCVRSVPLRNLPLSLDERRRRGPAGNRHEYELKLADELRRLGDDGENDDDGENAGGSADALRSLDAIKLGSLSRLCALAQTFGYALPPPTRTHACTHACTHALHIWANDESHTRNPTPNIPCWTNLYEQILLTAHQQQTRAHAWPPPPCGHQKPKHDLSSAPMPAAPPMGGGSKATCTHWDKIGQ